MPYFSDRECGETPQTSMKLTAVAWRGIAALIQVRLANGSFGAQYPKMCEEGSVPYGTDESLFWDAMKAEIPALANRDSVLLEDNLPLFEIMDMIEFCWRAVGRIEQRDYHQYWKHYHVTFDIDAGRAAFGERVNRIFQRNGLAYTLTEQGRIERLLPNEIGDALRRTRFQTGDPELNGMLETARKKFLNPYESTRREALEKLWDAWERIKTIEDGDKKAGITALLNQTAHSDGSKFRKMLKDEAKELTEIGNVFQIRHSETTQELLTNTEHVDYLFLRMFSLIHLILRATGRDG